MEAVNRVINPLIDLPLRKTAVFTSEGQLTGGVHVIKLAARVLENRAHLRGCFIQLPLLHALAVDGHAALDNTGIEVRDQTVDQPQDRGLAAAGRPGQQYEFPVLYRQTDIRQAA